MSFNCVIFVLNASRICSFKCLDASSSSESNISFFSKYRMSSEVLSSGIPHDNIRENKDTSSVLCWRKTLKPLQANELSGTKIINPVGKHLVNMDLVDDEN